ncbi:MAG: exosortase-associated EpsI family protein [Akkermansia sp.]|nr:exosortase-associated EpsI family protein [Akkermansia sp.]
MRAWIYGLLPTLLLGAVFSLVGIMPTQDALVESAIRPELPLGITAGTWRGERQQESEAERTILASDTKFCKALYRSVSINPLPPLNASIVYSGSDMNTSIHRPERCLPTQGHYDLVTEPVQLKLKDGRELTFSRILSKSSQKLPNGREITLEHVNYYIFIGHNTITHDHLTRTLLDMYDRVVHGYVERWAYYQVGTYYGEAIRVSREASENNLRAYISETLPDLVDWEQLDK